MLAPVHEEVVGQNAVSVHEDGNAPAAQGLVETVREIARAPRTDDVVALDDVLDVFTSHTLHRRRVDSATGGCPAEKVLAQDEVCLDSLVAAEEAKRPAPDRGVARMRSQSLQEIPPPRR